MKQFLAILTYLFSLSVFASDLTCELSVNPHGNEGETKTLQPVKGRKGVYATEVEKYKVAVVELTKGKITKLELLIETEDGKTVFGAFDKRQLDEEVFDHMVELEFYDEDYFVTLYCYKN